MKAKKKTFRVDRLPYSKKKMLLKALKKLNEGKYSIKMFNEEWNKKCNDLDEQGYQIYEK